MNHSAARISTLNSHITDEIFAAFGFETTGWSRRLLWPVFWLPAQLFARLANGVEQNIAQFGLVEAARRLLPRFVDDVKVMGRRRKEKKTKNSEENDPHPFLPNSLPLGRVDQKDPDGKNKEKTDAFRHRQIGQGGKEAKKKNMVKLSLAKGPPTK